MSSNSDPNQTDFAQRAMLKSNSNKVSAIVNVPSTFAVKGYTLIKIQDGVFCEVGMYYNDDSHLFYDDEAFTSINGVLVDQVNSSGQMESAA